MAPRTPVDQAPDRINQLVEQNLPLVGHLVRETRARVPAHVNREDLTSAAMMALVVAAQGLTPSAVSRSLATPPSGSAAG